MNRISAYLTFNGNCREAMTFYKECLGGELLFQTIGDSPGADQMPLPMKQNILHSTLISSNLVLMGTDMVGEQGLIKGNAVSLMLQCSSEKEIRACYAKLASGGKAIHPLANTFWGELFGMLTDKFGNHWLLNYRRNKKHSFSNQN